MPSVIPHKILDPINPNIPNHSKILEWPITKNLIFDNSTKNQKFSFLDLSWFWLVEVLPKIFFSNTKK